MKQVPKLKDINFYCCEYHELKIPKNSIIYCDPPYQKTDKTYKEKNFDHEAFFHWCREQVTNNGCEVYISEYQAPLDFKCIWQKRVSKTHPNQKKDSVERLFVFNDLVANAV